MNNKGEAVGVFAGSKPKIFSSEMIVLSRGVRPPAFNTLGNWLYEFRLF
ncbi:MAG: hypothetical protein KDD35_11130 [Bdellovibrionales bacterium]|nr:hypothetical protein [Bdellovibrionales bacterium]